MEIYDELSHVFWKDNMVNPVLFSQAVEAAFTGESPVDMVIELGPEFVAQRSCIADFTKITAKLVHWHAYTRYP